MLDISFGICTPPPPPPSKIKVHPLKTQLVLHYACCHSILLKVMVDDEIRDMPGNGDYPKFKETANKQKFILRFPKAANRIFYDPGLEVGEADAGALALKNLPHLSLALLVLRFILF